MSISSIDSIESFSDERGELIPIYKNVVPFEIQRMFYISNVPVSILRGGHAHKTTKQYLICLSGQLDVILKNTKCEEIYNLTKNQGIYIPELIWDEQKFLQTNTNILVLCSTPYNEDDYIRNFSDLLNHIK